MAEQSNVNITPLFAKTGLNLDSIPSDLRPGELSYALNACISGFDGNQITYQNEQGNTLCTTLPYKVIGRHPIPEKDIIVVFLTDGTSSEIGVVDVNTCTYTAKINSTCLNFSLQHPILKAVHKITNCNTEIYWTDGYNNRRFLDLDNLPFIETNTDDSCENEVTDEVDCNKLLVQPNFLIPQIEVTSIDSNGNIQAGSYQFAIQYSNGRSEGYTSYYSITNPLPIFDPFKVTEDFNYMVGKSIILEISNIDDSGYYDYFNLAVIRTVNNITTPTLVGTYKIVRDTQQVIYTGQNKEEITLTINDIFEKFPIYDVAQDLTTAQDILIWDQLTTSEQINYQKIWSNIHLQWQTNRLTSEKPYADELNVIELKGYFRDEIYALEGAFLLANGHQTDAFHIPSRPPLPSDLEYVYNPDVVDGDNKCASPEPKRMWEVYNTASSLGKLVNFCKEPVGKTFVKGSVAMSCSDEECTEQGLISLTFTFEDPTPSNLTLQLGSIKHITATGQNRAVGYDIFTPPAGYIPDPFYTHPNLPFIVPVPPGVTSYTISNVNHPGGFGGVWNCQSCDFPVTAIYAKPVDPTKEVVLNLSSEGGFTLTNIPQDPISIQEEFEVIDCIPEDDCYRGPWEYGEFAYWESSDKYPCRPDIWGPLADKPIRHHKFPDSSITHIHDDEGNIYPLGIRINVQELINNIRESDLTETQKSQIVGFKITRANRANNKSIIARGLINNVGKYRRDESTYYFPNYPYNDLSIDPFLSVAQNGDDGTNAQNQLDAFYTDESKERFTFHSPDTSFYQPYLGNLLKLETVEYGQSKGHFLPVKDHAKYKFLSSQAYQISFNAALAIGGAPTGIQVVPFFITWVGPEGAIQSYKLLLDIILQIIPSINFAYQYNSVGNYTSYKPVPNTGQKQRALDIASYAIPGIISTGDTYNLNNFQRETSVYLKTNDTLQNPSAINGIPEDKSRFTLSQTGNCTTPSVFTYRDVSSYYGTIKTNFTNQYGQIYSYQSIDTGYQRLIDITKNLTNPYDAVFGGDCFINKFSYKSKFPFFIDNRIGNNDESDVFYDDLGNVAYPTYWFSTDAFLSKDNLQSRFSQAADLAGLADIIVGKKINNLDCRNDAVFYQDGKMYLFSYGIPTFWCESEVNVDLRQATNSTYGDFYPHTSSDVPDEWLNTSIIYDNTYTYNKSYSKQNDENFFSHLPEDFTTETCRTSLPYRAIFSEKQEDITNYKRNNWLVYRPAAKFDFPQNYGPLTSLEGINNQQVIARFENKSLLYNALLTAPTSAADVYLGQSLFSSQVPPLDYGDTDLGYMGSQHRFFLKTPYGNVSVDSKRGQVFLIQGSKATPLSDQSLSKFLKEFLPFAIQKQFPTYNIDNNFTACGLHGIYDDKYNRFIFTKIDYLPLSSSITLQDNKFYVNQEEVQLTNPTYFCNYSFTLSYSFDTQSWTSFHSYIPNYYVGWSQNFFSGENSSPSLWEHNSSMSLYNNFYGTLQPYILEYPLTYKSSKDEILQSIKDYSKILQYTDFQEFIETDNIYYSHAIIYTNQQCSGLLQLTKKPVNNLKAYNEYPKYNATSKEILYTKSDSFYQFNTFWSLNKSSSTPIWTKSCTNLSTFKELNQDNMNYSKRSFNKSPIRSRDARIRLINQEEDSYKFVSQFLLTDSQISYK